MALSRIWSAFIIVAIAVAAFRYFSGDKGIYGRMVTGKADDPYDTVYYRTIGIPATLNAEAFAKSLSSYGYMPADSLHAPSVLISNNLNGDSIRLYPRTKLFTYSSIQTQLIKKTDGIIETAKGAVTICFGLIGIMALFLGFLTIAEKAGGIQFLARIVGPFFSKLFPDVPKGHPAIGHMIMNFSANLLNLDNAATPFGIKAMESLQELNPSKETASNAQLMFLCLHASGLTLIPVTVIGWRAALGAHSPTDIFVPCMIATFAATMAAMFIVSFRQKLNIFHPIVLVWVGGLSVIIALLVIVLRSMDSAGVQSFSSVLSNGIILLIFLIIILGALYKKINIFDAFVSGAKDGFDTAIRIIPYLVGLLVAISMLRTSGAFDAIITSTKSLLTGFGTDTRFVDGLPTALIKPLSGSGARGMMIDTMKNLGPDSFAGRLSCILQGSSDTTFYVVAVYFGAVSIKNTRYAVGTMLLADFVGIVTSIIMAYLFFGTIA